MLYGDIHNEISGGVFFGAVIQGRNVSVNLPPQITAALSGLPARSPAFTGRDDALDALLKTLDPAAGRSRPGVAVVSSLAGLAGVGKTELALQAAHMALRRDWFPGGVLFVNMYGYDETLRLEPGTALDGLLRALGMPGEHIPHDMQDRARLYTSILAAFAKQGRRILVLVDNVISAEQARPLLPADGDTCAIVTSRHTLATLDCKLLDLGILEAPDAVEMLEQAVNAARGVADERFAAQRDAATEVARLCGYLPLALRIVAALLAEDPGRPLTSMAMDLTHERTRIDELQDGERTVRAAFELSYRRLPPSQALVFRLLPVNPGPDAGTGAVAALAGFDERAARHALEALARAHLVERGATYGRWRMHDLVRVYAAGLAIAEGGAGAMRGDAIDRLFEYYHAGSQAADDHLRALRGQAASSRFANKADALAWLEQERVNLVAAVIMATTLDRPRIAVSLALALSAFLDWWRHFDDAIVAAETAVRAAGQAGDRRGEAAVLNTLGRALGQVRRFEESITAHKRSLAIAQKNGLRHIEGKALNNLGISLLDAGQFDQAALAHDEAVAIFREISAREDEAAALNNLGLSLRETHRFEDAVTAHNQGLAICRQIGSRHGEARALNNLGIALREARRLENAMAAHRQSIEIFQNIADPYSEAWALDSLGRTLSQMHKLADGIEAHQRAATIFQEVGSRYEEGWALTNLGISLREMRRFEEALTVLQRAAGIFAEACDKHAEELARENIRLAQSGEPA